MIGKRVYKALRAQRRMEAEDILMKEWGEVEETANSLIRVIYALPTHHLHPGIIRFVNLPAGWARFKQNMYENHGLVPVFQDIRHLANLPMSFGIKTGGQLEIRIHVPMQEEDNPPWRLLEWSGLPWITNTHHIELNEPNELLAVRGTFLMSIQKSQLEHCTKIGKTFIWRHATVASKSPTGCLGAIWAGHLESARSLCAMTAKPKRINAWILPKGKRFLADLLDGAKVTVRCGGSADDETLAGVNIFTIKNDKCDIVINRNIRLKPSRASFETNFTVQGAVTDWRKNFSLPEAAKGFPELHWTPTNLAHWYQDAEERKRSLHHVGFAIIVGLVVSLLALILVIVIYCARCCTSPTAATTAASAAAAAAVAVTTV